MKTLTTLALLSLVACAGQTPDPVAPGFADSDPAVEGWLSEHDAAWNAHDADAMAALFTEDATLIAPNGRRIESRASLRELFASPGPTKQTTSRTRLDALQWLAADVVLIDATQTLEGEGVAMLGSPIAHLTAVARREGDGFRVMAARVTVPSAR